LQGNFDKMQRKPTQFLPESHCAPRPWMGLLPKAKCRDRIARLQGTAELQQGI
jgi:hypothetical protein